MTAQLYHGSPVAGIKELQPRPSAVMGYKPVVFATPSRDVATVFSAPWTDDDFEFGQVNRQYYLKERYKNAFKKLLEKKTGYVYNVSGNFAKDTALPVFERVSTSAVPVTSAREVPNILAALRNSSIRLDHYDSAEITA